MSLLKSTFVPEYLNTDQNQIDKQTAKAHADVLAFQKCLTASKNLLNKMPSHDEQLEILQNKLPAVERLLKKECPIENVMVSKYIELKGMEEQVALLKKSFDGLYWNNSAYSFETGRVSVQDSYLSELEKRYTYYTKNQRQNDALETLREWAKGFNRAFDTGILRVDKNPRHLHHTNKFTQILPFKKFLAIESDQVVPNYYYISKIE